VRRAPPAARSASAGHWPVQRLPCGDRIGQRLEYLDPGWSLIKGTVLAAFVVYAVYFVLSWNQPTNTFSIIPGFPASLLLRRLLMPLWIFLQGLVLFAFTASRPTYILGHSYPHGVWFYFPVMFVLKSSLAFLGMLLLTALIRIVAKRHLKTPLIEQEMQLHWRAVWVFLFIFTGACILSRLTMSIRHFRCLWC